MRLIDGPTVYCISAPSVNVDAVSDYLAANGYPPIAESIRAAGEGADGGAVLIELAARLCYGSYGRGRKTFDEFYRNVMDSGHGSVLEHAAYGLLITGVSRALTHELVRHRAGMSYSQRSQRYVDEGDLALVVPPALAETDGGPPLPAFALRVQDAYRTAALTLTDAGYGRKQVNEAARAFLPNATATELVATGNARSWRHFLTLRGGAAADAEMRRLAVAVAGALGAVSPALFGDCRVGADGALTLRWGRV